MLKLTTAPLAIGKYFKDDFRDQLSLVEEGAKTQKGDAGKFLHMVAIGDSEVFPMIQGVIHPEFQTLPGAAMLDFMIGCPTRRRLVRARRSPMSPPTEGINHGRGQNIQDDCPIIGLTNPIDHVRGIEVIIAVAPLWKK
jgi:hypothetical protein